MKNLALHLILPFVVLLSSTFCHSQGWEKVFNDSFGYAKGFDVIETADGGYVMVGDIDLPTGAIRHHIWAVKTDQDGNELWSRIYDYYNVSYRDAKGIAETSSGDLLIVGTDLSYKGAVLKINADGDSLWTKFFGGNGINAFRDIIKTDNGDFILVGQYEAEANSQHQFVWAMGINENGDSLWSTTYFDSSEFGTSAMDISPLPDDHYLVTGFRHDQGIALEIDGAQGEEFWAKTYQFTTGDILLTGTINNTADTLLLGGTSAGFAGFFPTLTQTDLSGNVLNSVPFLSVNFGAITDIVSSTDGGFMLTGSSYEFWNQSGSDIGFIAKLNADLEVDWEITYEDSLDIQGAAIKQTSDGGYIMAGSKLGGMFLKKIGGMTNTVSSFPGDNFTALLYPNPAIDHLYLEIPEDSFRQNMSVNFYDSIGRIVDQVKINSRFELVNVFHFSKGFYQYVIFEKGRALLRGKLIVQ